MAQKTWELSGEYMESCNCDYLCPCIFTNPQAPATHEHCTALMVYRIDRGRHGDVSLDGLKFALVIRSGPRHVGRRLGVRLRRRRKGERRPAPALADIVSGMAGGPPQMIRDNLVSDFRGVEFRRIDFTIDGLRRATEIPGVLAFAIEGVASRNRSGEPFYIDNTAHPANRRLALARASKTEVQGFGLDAQPSQARATTGISRPLPGRLTAIGDRDRPSSASPLLDLLLRQRVVIVAALAGLVIAVLALPVRRGDGQMAAMDQAMAMPPKGAADLLLLLAMWWVMMVGMMLPSAAPMILTFATINRGRRARGQPYTPTALFTAGYLLAWGGFSVAATLAQWALERASLLAPMAMTDDQPAAGRPAVHRRRPLPAHAAQAVPASARAARRSISSSTTGATAPTAPCAWASRTASTASAAAGS